MKKGFKYLKTDLNLILRKVLLFSTVLFISHEGLSITCIAKSSVHSLDGVDDKEFDITSSKTNYKPSFEIDIEEKTFTSIIDFPFQKGAYEVVNYNQIQTLNDEGPNKIVVYGSYDSFSIRAFTFIIPENVNDSTFETAIFSTEYRGDYLGSINYYKVDCTH